MYRKILVPVDLAHTDSLEKSLQTAADLALHYDCPVCYAGVVASAAGRTANSPAEFAERLDAFVKTQTDRHGHRARSRTVISHDPSADLDRFLLQTILDEEADLVIMQSHMPGITEYIWPSNGGAIASHAKTSVFVVR